MKPHRYIWLGLFAVLVWTGLAFGQARTGEIYGTVTDTEGNPLPGVTVTVEHVLIGQQATITNVEGLYRFPSLPPGRNYRLRFELEGFRTVVRENIVVTIGTSVKVDVQMAPGGGEEIVVRGATPVVDIKSTKVAQNFTRDLLQELPTARDPWVMLELAPGVHVDRANIGGSESGQQSVFSARGASESENQFNLDGVTITDPAAIGASPTYYDFDAFEEIQIGTAGADVEGFTGGVNINFVTKRGGNRLSGGARYYYTGSELGTLNVQKLKEEGRLISPATRGTRPGRVRDFGFNFGGPMIKDHLWFWGAYGAQRIDLLVPLAEQEDQHDKTLLDNINAKVNAQIGKHNLEFLFFFGDKKKFGRGAAWNRPPETTYNQKGPSPFFKLQDEFFATDDLYISLKGNLNLLGFQLIPGGGTAVPVEYDYGTRIWGGTYFWYDTERPTLDLVGQAIYYTSGMGADHEIKIGAEYRYALVESQSGFGNGMTIAHYPPEWGFGAGEVWLVRPADTNIWVRRLSLYAQDTITAGRLTLILGLRFDHQKQGMKEAVVPAMTILGDLSAQWLPAGVAEAGEAPFSWNTLSPRLGLTFDITGDAKTLLKANLALYPQQLGIGPAWQLQPTQWREVDFWWMADLDGDNFPDPNEVDWSYPIWWDHTPGQPNQINTAIDPDYRSNKTLEVSVGIEREIVEDLGVAITGYYRRYFDFTWSFPWEPGTPEQVDETYYNCWVQVGNIPQEWGGWPYYACNVPRPGGLFYTNRPDYWRQYRGVEFRLTKRMSHGWSLFGSFTLQSQTEHYDSRQAYTNPTNIDQLNGQQYATSGWKYNWSDALGNVQWQAKIGGIVRLPLDFNLGSTIILRQGYILNSRYRIPLPSEFRRLGWGSTATVLTHKRGEVRHDTLWYINARLEKVFDLGDYGRIYFAVDGFNLTNEDIPTRLFGAADSPNYKKVLDLLAPRIFRVGVRYEF